MARRKRCPKCGELGHYKRVEFRNKKSPTGKKAFHEYVHKFSFDVLGGLRFRIIPSDGYCLIPAEA